MKTLIEQIYYKFDNFRKPAIIYSLAPFVEKPDGYRLSLQAEFEEYDKHELPAEKCSSMLFENVLISDEAILYFLPRLFEYVLLDDGNELFLYSRLEKLNVYNIPEPLMALISKLTAFLKLKEDLELCE
jgi:hypothetical protein